MRKLLLLLLVVCSINAMAQKRVKSFSAPLNLEGVPVNFTGSLEYNDEGNPSSFAIGITINYMGTEQNIPVLSTSYGYDNNSLTQNVDMSSMDISNMSTTAALENGLAKSLSYSVDGKNYSYEFDYDNGKLVSIAGDDEDGTDVNADLAWDNGNLTKYSSIVKGDSSTTINFEYSDVKSDPALNCILSFFIENQLTENSFAGLTPVKFFGLTCNNLPSKLYGAFYDKDEDTGEQTVENDTINLSYTIGDDGYVSKVTIDGADIDLDDETSIQNVDLNITWEDIPTSGLSSVKTVNNAVAGDEYYSLDGVKLPTLKQGINIVRHSDGTVQKLVVK